MVGTCISLLTCYCSVQARRHTSDPVTQSTMGASGARQAVGYNSSASVVSAVFLFFNIMISNAIRLSRPQLQSTIILYSIYANVSGTFAPHFSNMDQVNVFVRQLTASFFSGFAIAIVCHFLIFPFSVRDVVFDEMKSYFKSLQKVLVAEQEYLQSMESADMLREVKSGQSRKRPRFDKATAGLKASMATLSGLHAKLQADIPFAKREYAWDRLSAKNISNLFVKLQAIYLPFVGLVSMVDILERLAEERAAGENAVVDHPDNITSQQGVAEWNEMMISLHDPFEHIISGMSQGLHHVAYLLKLEKLPKAKQKDREAADPAFIGPGEAGFSEQLDAICSKFWERRVEALKLWCKQRGIQFIDHEPGNPETNEIHLARIFSRDHARQQLYMILYMEYLLHAAADAVCDLVKEADRLVETGTMKRRRLLVPGKKRLMKWLKAACKIEDSSTDNAVDSFEVRLFTLALGDAFKKRKNPEHLDSDGALIFLNISLLTY